MNQSYSQLTRLAQTLLFCCVSLLSTLSVADVDDGLQAYNKGDYTTARLEWMTAAEQGDPIALYNLGQLYRLGKGTFTDYHKAGDYYLLAARKGHIGAQRNLGFLYYHGRLGRAQRDQAFSWLSRAAAQGDPDSQWSVGTMLYNGDQVQADPVKAYAWYWLAMENGHENGQFALAALDKTLTAQQIKAGRTLAPSLLKTKFEPIPKPQPQQVKPATSKPKSRPNQTIKTPEAEPVQKQPAEQTSSIETTTKVTEKSVVESKPPTKTKIVKAPVADNFRVQLAALRSQQEAEKAWTNLKKDIVKLIAPYQRHTVTSDAGNKGTYYRLQLSPFETPEQAKEFCNILKQNDQACFINKTATVE